MKRRANKGYILHIYLMAQFTLLQINCRNIPLISSHVKRGLTNREKVKELQLQTMLKSLEQKQREEEEILAILNPKKGFNKRDTENLPSDNKHLNKIFGERIPWDTERRQVPFDALIRRNKETVGDIKKRQTDVDKKQLCKKKRSIRETNNILIQSNNINDNTKISENHFEKRSLNTQGPYIQGYSLYDELCEDAVPVEVVKVDRLVVEHGMIKDQNIIEKAMLM